MKSKMYEAKLKLAEPFSISFHTFTHTGHIFVTAEDKGVTGIGETCSPEPVTGDTAEGSIAALNNFLRKDINVNDLSLDDIPALISNIGLHTARAGADMLLHDLIGRKEGKPVYKLYSASISSVPNTIAISLGDVDSIRRNIAHIRNQFSDIKAVKLKLRGEEKDFDRVVAMVDACPKGTKFILDANHGFSDKALAIKTMNNISDYTKDVIVFEEPYDFRSSKELKEVRDSTTMPIFADESVRSLEDAEALIRADAIDGINIKIQKLGGICESKKIAEIVCTNNLKMIVGCVLESPVSISAGIAFAVSTPNVIMTDLDSDLELPPFAGFCPPFINGMRIPNETIGFGIDVKTMIDGLSAAIGDEFIFREI